MRAIKGMLFDLKRGKDFSNIREIYKRKHRLLPIYVYKELKSRRRCAICKKKHNAPLEIDHIVPLCDGGSNDLSNLRALCRKCHTQRHKEGTLQNSNNVKQKV